MVLPPPTYTLHIVSQAKAIPKERQAYTQNQQDEKSAKAPAARQNPLRSHPSPSTSKDQPRIRISSPDSSSELISMPSTHTRPGTMSSDTASGSGSSKSSTSRRSSIIDSHQDGSELDDSSQGKSLFSSAIEKTKAKFSRRPSGSERLAAGEEEYERRRVKEVERQKRKEEYERLGLGDRTKFGTQGAGRWDVG